MRSAAAPGVLSARFGGEGLDDAGRNVEMLRALDGVPPERRTARYRALIALSEPGGREAVTEGVVEGVLLTAPRGAGGFGYDPLFFYPPLDATFAEVPAEAKHAVSHRALAMARARLILAEWLRQARIDGLGRVVSQCEVGGGGGSAVRDFRRRRGRGATRPSRNRSANRSAISFSFAKVMGFSRWASKPALQDRTCAVSSRKAVTDTRHACAPWGLRRT